MPKKELLLVCYVNESGTFLICTDQADLVN